MYLALFVFIGKITGLLEEIGERFVIITIARTSILKYIHKRNNLSFPRWQVARVELEAKPPDSHVTVYLLELV